MRNVTKYSLRKIFDLVVKISITSCLLPRIHASAVGAVIACTLEVKFRETGVTFVMSVAFVIAYFCRNMLL